MAKRWYVVHAYSGFENAVKRSLEEHVKLHGMEDKFGEILVPTEEVVEMREGQKRKSERKFFPGYVHVEMEMDDETWHLVKDVPKVMGFIGGTSDRPAPITEKEANQILNRVQEGVDKPKPKVLFEPGEVVRVTDGPFNDFILNGFYFNFIFLTGSTGLLGWFFPGFPDESLETSIACGDKWF